MMIYKHNDNVKLKLKVNVATRVLFRKYSIMNSFTNCSIT